MVFRQWNMGGTAWLSEGNRIQGFYFFYEIFLIFNGLWL
jgi:hypothetical protein